MGTYTCPLCGNKYNSKKRLRAHMMKTHKMESEPPTQPSGKEVKQIKKQIEQVKQEPPPPEPQAEKPPEPPTAEGKDKYGEELSKLIRREVDRVLEERLPKLVERFSRRETVTERELEYEGGVSITKKVKLDPDVIKLYHYVLAHAESDEDKMTFDEFVNKTILEYFSDYLGIEPAILRKKVRKK